MAVSFQLVIDCTSPEPLAHFWAEALHYVIAAPTVRLRLVGRVLPVDRRPRGGARHRCRQHRGPQRRGTSHLVPGGARAKSIKNRIHIDVHASGGRDTPLETRRELVEAEAARLVALGATRLQPILGEGLDHYAVAMADPEGNEFDTN